MKLKDGFILHETEGEYILVATGEASENFNGYIRINESAAFLISRMMDGIERESLIEQMLEEYDVVRPRVEKDVDALIEKLSAIHALE